MPATDTDGISLGDLPKRLPAIQFWFGVLVLFCALIAAFALGSIVTSGKYEPKLASKDSEVQDVRKTLDDMKAGVGQQAQKIKELEMRIGFFSTYLHFLMAKDKYWTRADEITGEKYKVFPSALVPKDAQETLRRKAALEALADYVTKLRTYGKDVEIKNLLVSPESAGDPATLTFTTDLSNTLWILPSELQKQAAK